MQVGRWGREVLQHAGLSASRAFAGFGDVPTAEDCPHCGQTMFKKAGRGRMKPFCINENCEAFVPEDKRGYPRRNAKPKTEEEKPSRGVRRPKGKA